VHRQLSAFGSDLLALCAAAGDRGPQAVSAEALDIVTEVDSYASVRGEPLPNDDGRFTLLPQQHVGVNLLLADSAASLQGALPEISLRKGGVAEVCAAAQLGSAGTTLHQCLLKNAEREQLAEEDSVYCRKCKEHRRSYKRIEIWSLPSQLVVHLKRFGRDRIDGPLTKITTPVEFPAELNLQAYLAQPQSDAMYELYGVVNHHGGLGGGHYTAHALVTNASDDGEGQRPADVEWFRFDDSRVSKALVEDIDYASGYILFYRRRTLQRS